MERRLELLAELSAAGLAVAEAVNALHAALLAHDDSDDAHDRCEDAYELYAVAQRRLRKIVHRLTPY